MSTKVGKKIKTPITGIFPYMLILQYDCFSFSILSSNYSTTCCDYPTS